MANPKPESIDAYIGSFPDSTQLILNQLRAALKKEVPEAEETISYGIPALKYKGRILIYFAGYGKHVSIYPAPLGSDLFSEELSVYKGGKGTVQFPLGSPLPLDLIDRIVKFKAEEILKKK